MGNLTDTLSRLQRHMAKWAELAALVEGTDLEPDAEHALDRLEDLFDLLRKDRGSASSLEYGYGSMMANHMSPYDTRPVSVDRVPPPAEVPPSGTRPSIIVPGLGEVSLPNACNLVSGKPGAALYNLFNSLPGYKFDGQWLPVPASHSPASAGPLFPLRDVIDGEYGSLPPHQKASYRLQNGLLCLEPMSMSVLYEPFAGMSLSERLSHLDIMRRLTWERSVVFVVITTDYSTIEEVCYTFGMSNITQVILYGGSGTKFYVEHAKDNHSWLQACRYGMPTLDDLMCSGHLGDV